MQMTHTDGILGPLMGIICETSLVIVMLIDLSKLTTMDRHTSETSFYLCFTDGLMLVQDYMLC